MPVLVPLAFGAAGAAVAVTAGASIATAALVGVGAAIISHKSGAAGWVYDNIVKPVGRAVENVLTSDVGQFVLKAAATLSGNAWAVPLIDGAATLANGGNFGDALKSAAISYVGGKVGQLGGELASQAMVKAGASEFATQVVSSAAGSGAGRASVALIMGQDPVEAFIQGGISGGLGAAAGWLEQNTEGAFSKLPSAARNVITSGLSAALTGKELTPDLIWNALLTSEGVTKTVNKFLGENLGLAERLNDNQLSALTLGIQRTTATAFSGGDVPSAILDQLSRYGEQEFGKWLDDSGFGDAVNNTLDKITGDYQRAEAQAKKMDEVVRAHSGAVGNYNATVQEINAGVAEQERLRTLYERALQNFQANENQANADALNTAITTFNDYVTAFNTRYENTLKPNLDRYEQQVADLAAQFDVESETYDAFVADLSVAADRVAEELKPVYTELDRQFVRFMDPSFNEAEYRAIAGLDADEDAYLHWLSVGKEEGLPTNAADYQTAYNEARQRALMGAIERTGLDIADINPQQLQEFMAYIDQNYGGDLTRLRNAPQQTLADRFSSEYTENQRIIQALDEERADVRRIMDAWTGGQSIGISPVITDQVNELLVAAGRPPALVGERMTQEDFDALQRYSNRLTSDVAPLRDTIADFAPSTATKEEIATGLAKRIIDPDTGLMEWSTLDIQTPFWSPELGQMVYQQSVPLYDKVDTNTAISGYPEGVYAAAEGGKFTGEYAYLYKNLEGEWVGGLRYQPVSTFADTPVGKTLVELKDTAPAQFIEQTAALTGDAARIISNVVGDAVVEFSRNAVEYASTLDAVQSDEFKNTAGIALEAGGELLSNFNQIVLLANINPESTPLGALARDMLALGGGTKTAEWNAAVDRMNARMAEGTGWEKVASVWGGFQEAPVQFLAEIIGKEILQEIPILLASGGTGTVTKRLLQSAGEDVARRMATRAAIGAGATLDLAESFGGAAESAYDEAFATALNSGMDQAKAEAYARDVAISAGMIGATTTLVSMGVMDGNAFERAILARDDSGITAQAFDLLARRVSEGASVTWKEGVQESIEEGLPTLFTETVLTQIDPERDVLGSVLQAATLGAVAGSGVAAVLYTGHSTADALIRMNSTVRNTVNGGGGNPAATKQALEDLGITDEVIQNNLLSTVSDQYHSNGDVSRAFSAHPDFRVTNADILNGVLNSAGQDVTTYVNTYIDQRYVDIEEVKAAAAAEGVTLTDEQAQDMITQTADPEATTAALYSIQQKYDPQAVTEQEAREAFEAQGFNPTPEQLSQFTREGAEADVLKELADFVDVNQVTEEEARQFFSNIGYNPTDEEVAQFVRQQAETEAQAELAAYADPRMVDADEVRAAYEALGLSRPTDADVQALIGQYNETDLAGRAEENLPKAQFNSLQMQLEEFRQALENGGVPSDQIEQIIADTREQTRADLEALGYSFDESIGELRDDIAASEQRLMDQIAANEEAGMTRDEAIQAAVDELATEFGVAQEAIFDRIGETAQSLNDRISGVETAVEDLGTQLGDVENRLLSKVQELEDGGIARDEAIQSAVDDLATELGTTREELLAEIGATEETLLQTVAGAQEALETQIGDVEDRLLSKVQELEDSGVARDEALQTALGELATELGVTEESLLDRIGETEQSLLDQLADIQTGLEGQIGDVEDRLLSKVQELEDSGVARDEALQTALGELATELGVTEESLLDRIGETEQSLLDQLGGLETELGNVEDRLLSKVQELEDSGVARDEALQTALDELASELDTTADDLLSQLGETEQSLLDQIGGLETALGNVEDRLLSKVQELEDSGIARDEALQTALSELATELGVTETTLLTQMGETAQSLQEQLTGLETTTQADLDFIASLIGKPARDVTQVDIDFVADLIAQQEVITDLTMAQRQYDVTGDGQITQDDFALLEQALAGTDVTFAPTSAFGPATGLYAQNQAALDAQLAAEAETQALIDQQTQTQTQLATQLQTQIQTQDEMARRRAFGDLIRQQQDLYGQRVDVKTPDPMRINYFYDWQSIFATPQQASLFPSPYAKGGQVEGTTDKLLRIIGELE